MIATLPVKKEETPSEVLKDRILEVLLEWEPIAVNLETLRQELPGNTDGELLVSTLLELVNSGIVGLQTEYLMECDYPELAEVQRTYAAYKINHNWTDTPV